MADFVFIMGYDMTWLGAKPGSGAHFAGPNAPIDALEKALSLTITTHGAAPSKLILGLPWYGRAFTCDGSGSPAYAGTPAAPFRHHHPKMLLLR